MIERVYPKLHDGERSGDFYISNFKLDKQKTLDEKLIHYMKNKGKWSRINGRFKFNGVSVAVLLGGCSLVFAFVLNIPTVALVLGIGAIIAAIINYITSEKFISKHKIYFQKKANHVKNYSDKMETHFIKNQEGKQISPKEFEQFQKMLNEFEYGMNSKSEIKSKDVKKVEKMAKKELRQQRSNQLYRKTLQEFQRQKLN